MVLLWLKTNKVKFVVFDSILLLINVSILNFIRKGYLIDSYYITATVGTAIFFIPVFMLSKIGLKVTEKYPFFFITSDAIKLSIAKAASYGVFVSILLNMIFIQLIWINENILERILTIYFGMPWIVVILANTYSTILDNKNKLK
jgi:hypothetical protein